jgi:2-methylcitrate dehydratase PrpD
MTATSRSAASAGAGASFTAHVVGEVRKVSSRDLPEGVLERVRHVVLDWLGVSIAGAQQESARSMRQVLRTEGGRPVACVVGTAERFTARQAALATGVAGHSMDYDDMVIDGHPSVAVLPAVFAVAEEVGADGRTTVEALLWGYEAMSIIAAGCGNVSYARGFHWTGTFGAFGAAIAAGRLLDLDAVRLQQALGIAGTQAAGLRASFGTMSKHLNAGNAAAIGVLSARLAEAGFTGALDVIESPLGFAIAHNNVAGDFDPSRRGASLQDRLAVEQIMFKSHAACGGTHSAIDGIRALKKQRWFSSADVLDVELVVSDQLPEVCGIPEPASGTEGMFSIAHATSLALADRPTGPASFTDEQVRDPELVALRRRVRVTPVSRIPHPSSPAEVTVRLTTGEVLQACVAAHVVTPDEQLPQQWDRLEVKFRGLADPVIGAGAARDLIVLVRRVEALGSIAELLDRATARA